MGSNSDIFDPLRKSIKNGQVLIPSSPGYEESLKRWSTTCIKPAAVVVLPANAEEVSAAVKFATANKIPFVVKGGGHSTSGVSASDGGMVIDLGKMRAVSVDPVAKTVTFEGGCLWKDVDAAAWEHGLATVGGTVNDTGVGGLTLGGGYGFLTPLYGLACDLLISAQVVLADGSIVTASENENSDLFWGLRGAGQNFGVTTSFTSKAFDQGRVYTGVLIFPLEKIPELVAFVNKMTEEQDPKAMLLFAVARLPPEGLPGCLTLTFYNGSQAEGEKYWKPILDLGPLVNGATEVDYPKANDQLGGPEVRPTRKLMGGANFVPPLDPAAVQQVADEFFPATVENECGPGSMVAWEIVPNASIRKVGLDTTAFSARDNIYQIATLYQWEDPSKDGAIRAFNKKLVTSLKDKGIKKGVGQYNNYEEDPLHPEKAFGGNVKRLQELKKKYDPENVFWKWHSFFPQSTASSNLTQSG